MGQTRDMLRDIHIYRSVNMHNYKSKRDPSYNLNK